MDYITEIFERANLQQICEFLLCGGGDAGVSDKSYTQRIENIEGAFFETLRTKFPDVKEREKVSEDICAYTATIQNVYMEIGMRCGAILTMSLLQKTQNM